MTPERYRRLCDALARRQPDLTVIMDGVHKPHNIAAIVRTCDAVGICDMHAVLPDNRARSSAEAAMGSQRWVHIHQQPSGLTAIDQVRAQGMQVLAAHLSEHARPYREIDFTRPTALLLGTEKFGVSDEEAAAVDHHVVIPMMGMVESFNVSVAAAIMLAQACEQRRAAGLYDHPRLHGEHYRQTLFRWAHPRIAAHCERFGVPYPSLDERGEIADPRAFDFQLSEAIRRYGDVS